MNLHRMNLLSVIVSSQRGSQFRRHIIIRKIRYDDFPFFHPPTTVPIDFACTDSRQALGFLRQVDYRSTYGGFRRIVDYMSFV